MLLVKLDAIGKKYIEKTVSFDIEEGDFIIISGENGSGKSTIARIISGYIKTDFGKITREKIKISYMEERFDFPDMKASTYIKIMEKIKEGHADRKLINKFMIPMQRNTSKLSKGNRQKLSIVSNFIGEGKIIIFDEPVNGLDHESIIIFHDYLMKNKEDKAIIIVTHYPDVFEDIANKRIYL